MNEDARDGNSPTGQALGNLALLVAAPLTIAGGLYGGYRLSKGAWNMTKGARGKIAETAENVVTKAKNAKEIREISKDIKASNKNDSFMKNELKDLANDQRMDEKYIKQNNPNMNQRDIKDLARENTKANIQNKQLLSEVDVTGDLDGIFAEQSGFEGMNMPKGHAEYATGNSHGMATKEAQQHPDFSQMKDSEINAYRDSEGYTKSQMNDILESQKAEQQAAYDNHMSDYSGRVAKQRQNTPGAKLENNGTFIDQKPIWKDGKVPDKNDPERFFDADWETTGHQKAGAQASMFDADYGAEAAKAKNMKEQAHQNVMEKNSAFSQKSPEFYEPKGDQLGFDLDNTPKMETKHVESTPQIKGQQSMFDSPSTNEPRRPSGSRKINRNANRGTRTLGAPEMSQPTDFTKNVGKNSTINMPEKEFKGFAGYDANGNPIYV